MVGWCGIGRQRLNYRFRVPDAAGSPELREVRVQEPANSTCISANHWVEKQKFPPHNFRAALACGTVVLSSLDILPAINDQDSNRSPGGNVLRFALHRQGQNSQVSTRCHAMPCRGSLLVLPNSVRLGYRRAGLNVQPSTDRRKGFLPALNDWVSTLGVR